MDKELMEGLRKKLMEQAQEIREITAERKRKKQYQKDLTQVQLAEKVYKQVKHSGMGQGQKDEYKERFETLKKEFKDEYGEEYDE